MRSAAFSASRDARPAAITSRNEPEAEDEDQRAEPDRQRPGRDRDLLARPSTAATVAPAAVPANTLTSSACCTPAPPGVNGTIAATALTPSTSRTFFDRPADVERLEQEPERREAKHQPANCTSQTSRR
jgi:hypothetical protein